MIKTIKICDKCKRETKRLYEMPRIGLGAAVGLHIYSEVEAELCQKCAQRAIDAYRMSCIELVQEVKE